MSQPQTASQVEPASHSQRASEPETALPVIPAAAPERELLTAFLDYQRAVARRKAEDLSDAELRRRLPGHPSPLSIGGILKHLAWVETKWARSVFLGLPDDELGEPWSTLRGTDEDWEWDVEADTGERLLGWFDAAVDAARTVYADAPDVGTLSAQAGAADPGEPDDPDAERYQLRWILIHLIEEYARHDGHLDLLREATDGTTGN